MSTTESQAAAEAQYIDDWTGDEDGLFFITQRWGGWSWNLQMAVQVFSIVVGQYFK